MFSDDYNTADSKGVRDCIQRWFMQMLTRVHCRLWVESVGWKLCLAVAIWLAMPAVFRFNTHRAGKTVGILLCNFNI